MLPDFLRDYVRSHIQLVSILPDAFLPEDAPRGKWFGEDWQSAAAWAASENATRNLYWTLNLSAPINKKPKKTDIIGVRGFGIDVDPPKTGDWDKQVVLSDVMSRSNPSYVIDSARGLQFVYLTTEQSDQDTTERVNRGLSVAFGGDATHNIERLFRLPGTINHGDAKKRAAGYVPGLATLAVPFTGHVHTAAALLAAFPAPEAVTVEALPDGPDPRWTLGDKSDDEILKIMLSERPNLAASFGQGLTVRDLWEGKTDGYPGQSEADMALLSKISFYWGRNPAKIEEIFGRSEPGKRDKWKTRPDYRAMSIGKVVAGSENVYSVTRDTPATQELPGVTPVLQGEVVPGGEFMTIHEQKQYFEGCVYVADRNEVLMPSGDFLKPASFKSLMGGYNFEVGTECAPEKNAYLAFTENRLHKFPKVNTTIFEPDLPFGYISHNRNAVNVYIPDPRVEVEEGDVTPFLNHLALMLPDAQDQEILLTYMAALVQNPGAKFQWAPFIQGVPGNGKSMIGQILKRAVGGRYTHEPFSDDLANKFNDWLDNKILIIVEELSLGERVEVENNIKTWITQDEIEMQAKGGKKSMRPNKANWLILSNFKNAFPFDENQRRVVPFFTAHQGPEDVARDFADKNYFPRLWTWLRECGYRYITHYLRTRPLHPEYNPAGTGAGAARAPESSSTRHAVTASRGRLEQEIVEAIESGRKGFREPWVSAGCVNQLTKELHLRISPSKIGAALESLGDVKWGRSTQIVMDEAGTKPVLYMKRGVAGDLSSYLLAQGYTA